MVDPHRKHAGIWRDGVDGVAGRIGGEGGNRLDLGVVGERLHPFGIEDTARRIEFEIAHLRAFETGRDPGRIAHEKRGRIDRHFAADIRLDG